MADDLRETTDAFGACTDYMGSYLNQPETRAALHVGEHPWIQKDGGQPGNPVSDFLMRDQIEDTHDSTLQLLVENYQVLFYAGSYDGSSCNQLGIARLLRNLAWSGSANFSKASSRVSRLTSVRQGAVGRLPHTRADLTCSTNSHRGQPKSVLTHCFSSSCAPPTRSASGRCTARLPASCRVQANSRGSFSSTRGTLCR